MIYLKNTGLKLTFFLVLIACNRGKPVEPKSNISDNIEAEKPEVIDDNRDSLDTTGAIDIIGAGNSDEMPVEFKIQLLMKS